MSTINLDIHINEKLTVTIAPNEMHTFLMTTEQVAEGLGVATSNIRKHKERNAAEFTEGVHFIMGVTNSPSQNNAAAPSTKWTKRGVIRLSMLVKSPQAKLMRDWAEDVIYKELVAMESRVNAVRPTKFERQGLAVLNQEPDVLVPTFNKPNLQRTILEVALRATEGSPEARLVNTLKNLLFS